MTPLDHIQGFHDELTAIRHDLHAHPELGLQEHRTAGIVADLLEGWGIEVHRGVGQTGVVGVIRGGNGARAVGLRADMDALPIEEATGLAYASTTPGVMHACGHDGHTTMLLGAARYLAETRNFDGVVNLIFQPAEEGIGGALAMLGDKLFERFPCQGVFGMHNHPGMPVGRFAIRPGAMMAGGAFFDVDRERPRHARRAAGGGGGPGGGGEPRGGGAAERGGAQREAHGHRRAELHRHPGRRGVQRDPGQREAARHPARLPSGGHGADGGGDAPRLLQRGRGASAPRRRCRCAPSSRRW